MIQVEISSVKKLYGLTQKDRDFIKEQLMIPNPAYAQAKRYSKWNNVKVPQYLSYYIEKKDHLVVPVGYTIPFDHEVVEDLREEVTVAYPRIKIKLRDTQKEAYSSYLKDTDKGIICLPTGKGKSILGIYLAYALKQRTLIIVHKEDLVTGWTKDIKMCLGDDVQVGLYKAKKKVIGPQLTIATIQTLSRLSDEEFQELTNKFGMVIVDEMHHISSSIYGLVNEFNAPYKVGLTATPERKDKLECVMHFYLGDFAYKYVQKKGEVDKDILPVKVITSESGIEYLPKVTNVGTEKKPKYKLDPKGTMDITDIKDFRKRPQIPYAEVVNLVVTNRTFMDMYIKDILHEYNQGRSCVVFLSQKEHCRIIKEELAKSIPDEDILLYYGDSKMKKEDMMNLAENKRKLVTIATYSIATEGTNVKQWEVAFLVASVNDGKNVEQAVGRIRRVKSGKKLDEVIVYDYRHSNVYMMDKHGYTRNRRYKKLMFKVESRDKSKSMFSRGYSRK